MAKSYYNLRFALDKWRDLISIRDLFPINGGKLSAPGDWMLTSGKYLFYDVDLFSENCGVFPTIEEIYCQLILVVHTSKI